MSTSSLSLLLLLLLLLMMTTTTMKKDSATANRIVYHNQRHSLNSIVAFTLTTARDLTFMLSSRTPTSQCSICRGGGLAGLNPATG